MTDSLKFLTRGLDRAIRTAPDESVSSPGYLTILRLSDRSFGKSRIFFAKVSCMTSHDNQNRNRDVEMNTYKLEGGLVSAGQFQMTQSGARLNQGPEQIATVIHRMQGKRNFQLCK